MPVISKRLSCIAEFVQKGAKVCDVGTDHGYLAIHLVKNGIAKSVIATDIHEKPLSNARKNIESAGVFGIELRLCDGLSGIKKGETDTVIIAGMGGEVISDIVEKGINITAEKDISLILQPTTSPEFLRRFLYGNGYEIENEKPVFENGKLYSVILVKYVGKKTDMAESFYYIGKVKPSCEAGLMYIKKQQKRCEDCMKSLKSITEKKEDFLRYKTAFYGIENYLKSFAEENSNGV